MTAIAFALRNDRVIAIFRKQAGCRIKRMTSLRAQEYTDSTPTKIQLRLPTAFNLGRRMSVQEKINGLSDRQFENLTFDLAALMGFQNIVWRTPGSDGGRDIEAVRLTTDITGHTVSERWFIECKRYKASVSWPTLWEKIAHADALAADFLLLSTNSNPSPMCEERITQWNLAGRRPRIRVFRGYDFPRLIRPYPGLAASYGLSEDRQILQSSLLPISQIGQKIAGAALLGASLGRPVLVELEASSAINELVATRLSDLQTHGKFVKNVSVMSSGTPPWITGLASFPDWDEAGLRAVTSCFRYLTQCQSVSASMESGILKLTANSARCELNETTSGYLTKLQAFTICEISQHWGSGSIAMEGR